MPETPLTVEDLEDIALFFTKAPIDLPFSKRVLDGLLAKINESPRVKLPNLFEGLRVEWFIDSGDVFGRGTILAVYSDGTIDVESDSGNVFKGWPLATVRRSSP